MHDKPKKSSHFFHELELRNVYRVLAMYLIDEKAVELLRLACKKEPLYNHMLF